MMYIAKIDWYYEGDDTTEQYHIFVPAGSYVEAMEKLVSHFGELEIVRISLESFSPDNMLIFNQDEAALFDEVVHTLSEDIVW